jgi:lysyl oxidase
MTRSAARRRTTAVALTALALAAPLALGSGPAQAAATPALALETAQRSVTLTRYSEDFGDGEEYVYVEGSLGVHVVAGDQAFEVRAKRPSYRRPVVLTLTKPGTDPVLGTARGVTGLPNFWTTTIADKAGKVIERSTTTFCPNRSNPVRRRPDAPASSPYPEGCRGNPYSLGGVFGLQAGYAVPAVPSTEAFRRLPFGTYTVSVEVASSYRRVLGLTEAGSRASVAVTLVEGKFEEEPDEPEETDLAAADAGRAERSAVAAAGPAGPAGEQTTPTGPLPDLRSLPAWGIGVEGGRHLTFAATVWNAGPGRLVVDGFRRADNPDVMDAYQYFFSASGEQQGYTPVGTMEWDARDGHDHWHFTDFATYRLLDADKKLVVRSGKEAFCLANTDAVDYTVPGANWRPSNTDLHTSCGDRGSLAVREVLDTGSGDTYAQYLPGQSFDLRGLANGTYYIEVRANPDKALVERRTDNNASYRRVVVRGPVGKRTVVVDKIGIVDETSFIDEGEGEFEEDQ